MTSKFWLKKPVESKKLNQKNLKQDYMHELFNRNTVARLLIYPGSLIRMMIVYGVVLWSEGPIINTMTLVTFQP